MTRHYARESERKAIKAERAAPQLRLEEEVVEVVRPVEVADEVRVESEPGDPIDAEFMFI